MDRQYLRSLEQFKSKTPIGNKARQIIYLKSLDYRVPKTHICVPDLQRIYKQDPQRAEDILDKELALIVKPDVCYAVRSAANVEDQATHSFAGQFKTYLDVSLVGNVKKAVIAVWESAYSDRVQSYIKTTHLPNPDIEMTVLIQEMVTPEYSGVVFSRNPLTGFDEIIIEAVAGRGDQLVEYGVNPERWVYKWGEWIEKSVQSALPDQVLQELVKATDAISDAYGKDVDLEWVYDGENIFWVQLRDQTEKLETNIYSNRISREFLPHPVKPLLWSINIPATNATWLNLFSELIGKNDLDPLQLAKSFFGRVYFNMGVIGEILESLGMQRETLEILMGVDGNGAQRPTFRPGPRVVRHIPRILKFGFTKLLLSKDIERNLSAAEKKYAEMDSINLAEMNLISVMTFLDQIIAFNGKMIYFNIITPLLMQFHFLRLRRKLDDTANVDIYHYKLNGDEDKLAFYDPNPSLRKLSSIFRAQPAQIQQEISTGTYSDFISRADVRELQNAFEKFINDFGHLSERGNDFTEAVWSEDPDFVLKLVIEFSDNDSASNNLVLDDLNIGLVAKQTVSRLIKRARRYQIYREAIGFYYTFGYSLLRKVFLEIGRRLVELQVLAQDQDIFYLNIGEIREVIARADKSSMKALVNQRQIEFKSYDGVFLPEIIFGDKQPPIMENIIQGNLLNGTATSGGYYEGNVRVIRNLEHFERLQSGEVLVIPYSDIGWTPIFGKAGAVVAESGGLLSHSSIVAREFGIPAVVSVNNACALPDGTRVIVDGYKGHVYIHGDSTSFVGQGA